MDTSFKTIDKLLILYPESFHNIWLIGMIYNFKQGCRVNKRRELEAFFI